MMALDGLRSVAELSADKPHGTRLKYIGGCRCVPCRAANSRYASERAAAIKRGESNGLVSADKARRHLLKLSRLGIGRRAVAEMTGIGLTTLMKIKSGGRAQIREAVERKILAVGANAPRSAGQLVDAGQTWARINWLLDEGFTRGVLAKRLGAKTRALQIGKKRVTARTAAKVERLYNLMRLGE